MSDLTFSMTPAELKLFAETVAALHLDQHQQSPRVTTAHALLTLTGAERLVSYRWDQAGGRYHEPLLINLPDDHAQHYLEVLQDHDPITPKMRSRSRATRIDEIMLRHEFERLDFYNDFLRPDDIYHGVNVFLRSDRRDICDFRLFRGKSGRPFAQRDLVLIDLLSSYLVRAVGTPRGPDLRVLTAREAEIAGLVAKGCTDSDIKRILEISFSTVRTHVNRCFEKLGCANRAELAAYVSQRRPH